MQTARIEELLTLYRNDLLQDNLPFWLNHGIDREYGGFLHYLDRDGSVYHTDKSLWVQGRFTWVTALLYNEVEKRPEWLAAARQGIEFIEKHGFDTDGRMFFEVTRDGRPLRKRRYLFAETFGVIAFAEYARAAGDLRRFQRARDLYHLLVDYVRHPERLPPKVIPETRQTISHALTMILVATSQQLRKTCSDPLINRVIDECLERIFTRFMHPDKRALLETVGPKGEFLDTPEGRCVNAGHAIETAWFILEEYRQRRDPVLLEQACRILDWSLEWGWDREFGGLLYFVDIAGKPCEAYEHDMKLWWPHNEALYACLLAHHLTGESRYADWYERLHEWAFARFPDREHGEWFKYLHRDGTLANRCKGNRWAGMFHVPRMQLNCWKLLETMRNPVPEKAAS